jgi:colanic acid biosynthesis glycosyl transferase WcaI
VEKRVLIYGINYAPEIAGVGRYSGEIGAYLAAQGHDVTVVTAPPHYPGWAASPGYHAHTWSHESLGGAKVVRCPLLLRRRMHGVWRLLAPLTFALSSAPVLIRQALKRRPDIVLVVEPTLFAAPVGLLAAKLSHARTVLHVQDLELEAACAMGHLGKRSLAAKVGGAFDKAMTRGFDRVITISNRMAQRIADKGVDATRIHVVRNWVDLEAVKPQPRMLAYRRELGLKPDDFVVLYSGNLGAKQGLGVLLDAARALAARPEVVIAIAGRGPMRPQLEKAAAGLPNLRLYDFQPEARFGEFMGVADLHVLPQASDAADLMLPSKLGGMLASGRPIVVTANRGTELDRFLDGICTLTPPGDAEALARAILDLQAGGAGPSTQAARLERAAALSKRTLLPLFAWTALFSTEPINGQARAA